MSAEAPRTLISEARPPAAWLLVAVAAGTLFITDQLALWVSGVQALAIAISYRSRLAPHAWQYNGVLLNLLMMGITGVTIAVALNGHPTTIALAHFTALVQGLQLIDARPRKSEFLLVTMALFQVILAANLTDSILFVPLLAIFVIAATWTLIVHTLRTEANAAGDFGVVDRALTPGVARMTMFTTLLSLVLALGFFVSLPRLRSSVLTAGLGSSRAVAGFSDELELGTIGRIRQDATVVLRVETLEGNAPPVREAYWRGLAFDAFDGRSWMISPNPAGNSRSFLPGAARFGIDVAGGIADATLVQRIVREPVEAGVLFGAGPLRRVEGPLLRLELDRNGGVYAPAQIEERIRYTVWSRAVQPGDARLAADRTSIPSTRGDARRPDRTTVTLPELDPRIEELAATITAGLATDAERARAIESHLRTQGRYTDSPPDMNVAGATPVEAFLLGELAGHCEYFASGMVVLARSLGLPSRLVNGFAGGRENSLGGFVELTRSDAHAWVEVHYEDAGWVRYDPTPPDLRLRALSDLGIAGHLAELASAVELWWFQRVVDFDTSDQIAALRGAFSAWRSFRSGSGSNSKLGDDGKPASSRFESLSPQTLIQVGLFSLAVVLLLVLLRRRGDDTRAGVPAAYASALRALARHGLERAPSQAAWDFADDVASRLAPTGAHAFSGLTESYLAQRFGAAVPASDEQAEQLEALQLALHDLERPRD